MSACCDPKVRKVKNEIVVNRSFCYFMACMAWKYRVFMFCMSFLILSFLILVIFALVAGGGGARVSLWLHVSIEKK